MGNNIAFWKYSRVVYGGDDTVGIKWYCFVLCVGVIGVARRIDNTLNNLLLLFGVAVNKKKTLTTINKIENLTEKFLFSAFSRKITNPALTSKLKFTPQNHQPFVTTNQYKPPKPAHLNTHSKLERRQRNTSRQSQ